MLVENEQNRLKANDDKQKLKEQDIAT